MEGKTILLVDDQESVRKSIPRGFPEYNWITARDGREALALLEDQRVDLFITDVRMPEMDGIELIEKVEDLKKSRDVPDYLPHIVLTGYDDLESGHPVIKNQGSFFVNKPWGRDLEVTIDRALEYGQLHRSASGPAAELWKGGEIEILCHDISGYLGIGMALTDELGSEVLSEHGHNMVSMLKQSFEGANNLIDHFYSSRLDRQDEDGATDLSQTLKNYVEGQLRHQCAREGTELVYDIEDTPQITTASEADIFPVVTNLVSNALEALRMVPEGSRKLAVKLKSTIVTEEDLPKMTCTFLESVGEVWELEITDSGPGIPRHMMPHLFLSTVSIKEDPSRHGLGLMSVRESLRRIGGSILVDSSYILGTRMFVYLPNALCSSAASSSEVMS